MGTKPAPVSERYAFGPFELDVSGNQLTRAGQPITLPTRRVFDTLVELVRHRDRVLPKEELIKLVWPDAFVTDDSLTQCISILRRALDDDSSHPTCIATIPRIGYRFVAPVVVVSAPPADLENPSPDESQARPASLPSTATGKRFRSRALQAAALLLAVVAGFGARALLLRRADQGADVIRLTQSAPPDATLVSGAELSPDGQQIVFVARDDRSGITRAWVRRLSMSEARPLPGTERAVRPFWSPDGESIAFFADGKLQRISVTDAASGAAVPAPMTIAMVGYVPPTAASWGTNGLILCAWRRSTIYAVPASGGAPRAVTALDESAQETSHGWPQWLPDGRHFLFAVTSAVAERSGTYVGSVDSPERVQVVSGTDTPAVYAPPGHLLLVRNGVLTAQRFDLATFAITGDPVAIAEDVSAPAIANGAVISAAKNLLSFGGGPTSQELAWFDRGGQRLGTVDAPVALLNVTLSPNQQQLVAQGGGDGIWLVDLDRGAPMKISAEGIAPLWAPDGNHVVFAGGRDRRVHVRRLDAAPQDDRIVSIGNEGGVLADWSHDGQYLLFTRTGTTRSRDLWIRSMVSDEEPRALLDTAANEVQPRISPDGRWVAYTSDESGAWEVYIQSFPAPGLKRAVSVGGGFEPQWRPDGRELFYLAPDRTLMVVDVSTGSPLRLGKPAPLFRAATSADPSAYRNRYAVTGDGKRFLINAVTEAETSSVTMVINAPALYANR